MLRIILFLLPLGLDTLGVSIGLGIKNVGGRFIAFPAIPLWLRSAILFALAETIMPIVGLAIGYAASTLISGIMNIIGALLLIAVGGWELLEEILERYKKKQRGASEANLLAAEQNGPQKQTGFAWGQQLLLALSISLDELAVGFSFGTFTARVGLSPFILCAYIGLQGLLMAVIGISIGRVLRGRLRRVKEWSELLSGVLLVGLGVWLLVT